MVTLNINLYVIIHEMIQEELVKKFQSQDVYQITVVGKVEMMGQLNDFNITHNEFPHEIHSTLSGKIEDQAALRGVINYLTNNNFEVISIIKLNN